MPRLDATDKTAFTGRRMLAVLVAFFGVVIAVNLTLALFASSSWTGLVVENSYVASQQYNRVIAAERRQEGLGWQARFSHDAGGLTFTMTGRDGAPLTGLDMVLTMGRPSHEGEDRVVRLSETAPGVYHAGLALPAGLWQARVVATGSEGNRWRGEYRYINARTE